MTIYLIGAFFMLGYLWKFGEKDSYFRGFKGMLVILLACILWPVAFGMSVATLVIED